MLFFWSNFYYWVILVNSIFQNFCIITHKLYVSIIPTNNNLIMNENDYK